MKAIEARDYQKEFPEIFNWGLVDSPKLASLASILRSAIEHDKKTANRNLTPGLRASLNYLAELADI